MQTFTLHLPQLTQEQQFGLEEALLKVPQVDAMAQDGEATAFQVTAADGTLRDAVAALYGWGSQYQGMLLRMTVSCDDRDPMLLGRHSPNDVIHYLATCGQAASSD